MQEVGVSAKLAIDTHGGLYCAPDGSLRIEAGNPTACIEYRRVEEGRYAQADSGSG
ncbi:hypothetical protein PSEUDO8Z_30023 [Pseudomonas sp. 8Z]|nr:hypothetical protein PSEUDO8Z_30023 [Pseudomonas sp. 8Z]